MADGSAEIQPGSLLADELGFCEEHFGDQIPRTSTS